MSSNIMAICDKGVEAVGRLYKARMHADYSAGMRSIPLPEAVQNASGRSTEMRIRVCSGRKKQKSEGRAWQKRRTRQRPSTLPVISNSPSRRSIGLGLPRPSKNRVKAPSRTAPPRLMQFPFDYQINLRHLLCSQLALLAIILPSIIPHCNFLLLPTSAVRQECQNLQNL